MYILPSYTEFSLAELLPYILESPNCSCNGLSTYIYSLIQKIQEFYSDI